MFFLKDLFRKWCFSKEKTLQEYKIILNVVRESVKRKMKTEEEYKVHFLFGLPKSHFYELFVSNLSLIVPYKDSISDIYFTLLQGRDAKRILNVQSENADLTIGDDIELLIDQSHDDSDSQDSKNNFLYTSESSSVFQNSDEFLEIVKCK